MGKGTCLEHYALVTKQVQGLGKPNECIFANIKTYDLIIKVIVRHKEQYFRLQNHMLYCTINGLSDTYMTT